MTCLSLEDRIKKERDFILYAELLGLLHDVGKLSSAFLKYRQEWKGIIDGWNKDPHDHLFFKCGDCNLLNKREFTILKKIFNTPPSFMTGTTYAYAEDATVEKAVHTHIDPQDELITLLKAADGKDAAQDRNNPLFSADQIGQIYDADVFGAESLFNADLEKNREELYRELNNLIPNYLENYLYEDRQIVLDAIKLQFDNVFSDTTRPDNDTSLWEHCYAVAAIFKALLVHNLIYNEKLDRFSKVHFGIMGIGWDGLSFISQGHKIGDIKGREETISCLKEKIKREFEYEYILGNCIYEDINGVYFLIPSLSKEIDFEKTDFDQLSDYGKLLHQMKSTIVDLSIQETDGDIYPKFFFVQDTPFMTQIVSCIQGVKKKALLPLPEPNKKILANIERHWQNATGKTVCPICRLRPINDLWDICDACNKRRVSVYGKHGKRENDQTPFVSEIVLASKPKRAALLVAKFSLNKWLVGKMIRSLFITGANGLNKELKELTTIKSFETEESEIKQWLEAYPAGNLITQKYKYQRIREEINRCYEYKNAEEEDYAKHILFLYDRRSEYLHGKRENIYRSHLEEIHESWKRWLDSTLDEYKPDPPTDNLLQNILCAKTPTPSTILDVWNTTQKFFEKLPQTENKNILWTERKSRIKANIPKPPDERIIPGATYEGTIEQERVDILWLEKDSNEALLIGSEYTDEKAKRLTNKKIALDGKPFRKRYPVMTGPITNVEEDTYSPVRIITTTPDLFLAIVPAERAVMITRKIYAEYLKRFGKVVGRLPFSIGNIFFAEKTPMFTVLDSARRMVNNFEKLAEQQAEIRVVGKDHHCDETTITNKERLVFKFDQITYPSYRPTDKTWCWKLSFTLGDGNDVDYYHPYFMVKKGSKDYSSRDNYFPTVVGEVIHFNEVEAGDVLHLYPNHYDYEFLDSNARRYDLALNGSNRRTGSTGRFLSKPYLLDELEQGLEGLWEKIQALMPGITDTKLRNIESLWLSKLQEWDVNPEDKDSEEFKRWTELVEATLKKEFLRFRDFTKPENQEALNRLKESIISGLFFDCLELNFRILKNKLGVQKEEP